MSKTMLMSQQALSKHPLGLNIVLGFGGVVRCGETKDTRRGTCHGTQLGIEGSHAQNNMRKMTGRRSRSCGRSEAPPVAWEDSMEEVSPEQDGEGSGGEEGIPDEGATRAGDPRWVHGNCENNKRNNVSQLSAGGSGLLDI